MKKTIDQVFRTEGSKIVNVKFTDGTECMAFTDTQFGDPLEKGQESECVIVTKTSKNTGKQYEQLTQWGAPVPKQPGFGGGGGFKAQKTPGDIAVMQTCALGTAVAALVGKLVEFGVCKDLKAVSEAYNALYGVALSETLAGIRQVKAEVS